MHSKEKTEQLSLIEREINVNMNTDVMFSSVKDDWETPQEFFNKLNQEFNFSLDPCANDKNHKCEKFFTKEQNGLVQSWNNEIVFCNPPYGKEIKEWVKKCYIEQLRNGGYVNPVKN